MQPMKRLPLKRVINCRDLGGYPAAGGRRTQFARILRCGIPDSVTPEDMQLLQEYGIRAVMDLRGDYETHAQPSSFLQNPAFQYHHISLYEINPAVIRESKQLWDVYESSVEEYGANYLRVLRQLAAGGVPTLVHCFLGKDRTGILCALLLALAGVGEADIIADYQVSAAYLRPFYQQAANAENGLMWETNREHLDSTPENMRHLLAFLRERYSGAQGYVRSLGLSEGEIATIRSLMLEEESI